MLCCVEQRYDVVTPVEIQTVGVFDAVMAFFINIFLSAYLNCRQFGLLFPHLQIEYMKREVQRDLGEIYMLVCT